MVRHSQSLNSGRWRILCVIAAIAIGACGNSSAPTSGLKAVAGGTVTFRLSGDFGSFDPHTQTGNTSYILQDVYASLVSTDPHGKPIPYLAQSWTVTPTSVTFHLRNDVTCSDGTRLTPTDVRNSYQRMIDIKAPFNVANFGPGPYSLSADDAAGTFTFTVGTAFSDLIYGFTDEFPGSLSSVICPAGLAHPDQLTTNTFGAGPYTVTNAVHGDQVTLKLRPEFAWGPNGTTSKTLGLASTLIYKVVNDETTAANLLLTKGLDVGQVNGSDLTRLLGNPSLMSRASPSYTPNGLVFNERPNHPGDDPVVRQALITAVDPKVWLQAADNGHGRLSPSFETQDAPCFDTGAAKLAPQPSVTAAQKVLTDAGWTLSNGKLTKNGQQLNISLLGSTYWGSGPEYVQSVWTQMGVNVTLSNSDFATFVKNLLAGNFDATFVVLTNTLPSPSVKANRVTGPASPKGSNYAAINDPILERDTAAGHALLVPQSCQYWVDFQEELWKSWHLLPLDATTNYVFSNNIEMSLAGGGGSPVPSAMMLRRVA